jgi:hypothetical protein
MPRRKRTIRAKSGRNFSPELAQFLAGNDEAFSNHELADAVLTERYFAGANNLEALMDPAELSRFTALLAEHDQRRLASEMVHYRRLAVEAGFLQRWLAFVERGVTPDFAFEYSRTEHFAKVGPC